MDIKNAKRYIDIAETRGWDVCYHDEEEGDFEIDYDACNGLVYAFEFNNVDGNTPTNALQAEMNDFNAKELVLNDTYDDIQSIRNNCDDAEEIENELEALRDEWSELDTVIAAEEEEAEEADENAQTGFVTDFFSLEELRIMRNAVIHLHSNCTQPVNLAKLGIDASGATAEALKAYTEKIAAVENKLCDMLADAEERSEA